MLPDRACIALRWLLTMVCAVIALASFLYLEMWYHNPLVAALCPTGSIVTYRLFFDACLDLRVSILYNGIHFGAAALVTSIAVLASAPGRKWGSALCTAWLYCAAALIGIALIWILSGRVTWVGLASLASSLVAALVLIAARDALGRFEFGQARPAR